MTVQHQYPGGTMPRGWQMPHININVLMLVGLALALLLLAISTASQVLAPNTVNLSGADAGKQVVLKPGDTLAVSLSGNPTTGYRWVLDSTNQAILKPMGEPAYAPDSALIGAGGTYTWRFSAVAAGEVPLRLVYQRPWEQDLPPPRTFEVTVVVK